MRAILAHEFWKVKRHIFLATNHRKESATFSVKSYTHGVEGERAPLHRALHPVPAPAQMDHEGQDSAGQTAFGLDEAASQHDHQDDTNAEGSARRQGSIVCASPLPSAFPMEPCPGRSFCSLLSKRNEPFRVLATLMG
jgi:hypothetical protein